MKKFLAILISVFFLSQTAQGRALEQSFGVRVGLFDAADLTLVFEEGADFYHLRSEVATAGLFGRLYAFRAMYETRGRIRGKSFLTDLYRYRSQTNAHIRTKELHFNPQGLLTERLSSKDGKQKNTPIDHPEFVIDAYDLQTVFAKMANQYEKDGFCALEQTVFDGKRAYRVVIEDDGDAQLSDEYGFYRGNVWKCSMFIKKIQTEDDDMLWEATAERPIYFYIARDGQTKRPFLARIELEKTPLGRMTVYATKLKFKD